MAGFSTELVLAIGYAAFLAMAAFILETMARHVHRRCLRLSTVGFTYHPDGDIWRFPREQHLIPISSDSHRGKVIYRAPASACNSCCSKHACTDLLPPQHRGSTGVVNLCKLASVRGFRAVVIGPELSIPESKRDGCRDRNRLSAEARRFRRPSLGTTDRRRR